ncbi:MAG TPA: radical SAM protein [Firmicutes bacterium]|nr:radical SAM protein [Bacillota bacterium]
MATGRELAARITLRVRAGQLQLVVGPRAVYVFDRRGRLMRAARDGHAFAVGLDNRVLEKWDSWRAGRRIRERRRLEPGEWAPLRQAAREAARQAARAMGRTPGPGVGQEAVAIYAEGLPLREIAEWLERAAGYGEELWQRDARLFAQVYSPVSIMPPDQYGSLVLQATLGCSYNRCTFCTFYRDRVFRIRSPEQFRLHVQAVQELLGEGIQAYHQIFLGDANALVAPLPLLLELFAIAREALPHVANPAIASFLDVFTGRKKGAEEFTQLVARGLRTVYLGVESGSPEVLKFLNKPGGPEAAEAVVTALKAAGAAVGLIFLVGAGGRKFREKHREESLGLVARLPLDVRDVVYLSPLIDAGAEEYRRAAANAGVEELTEEEMEEELHRWVEEMTASGARSGRGRIRVTLYDIREFLY